MTQLMLSACVLAAAASGDGRIAWNYSVLCLSDDLRLAALAPELPRDGQPQSILVWDLKSEKIVAEIPGNDRHIGMQAYKFFGDERLLLSDGKKLAIYDLRKSACVWQTTLNAWVGASAVSPSNDLIAASTLTEGWLRRKGAIHFFRKEGASYVAYQTSRYRTLDCLSLSFDASGDSLLAMQIGDEEQLLSLSSKTGELQYACTIDCHALVAFAVVGELVIVGNSRGKPLIINTKAETGMQLLGHGRYPSGVCVSRDLGLIVTADDHAVCVWKIDGVQPLWWFRETEERMPRFTRLFLGRDRDAKDLLVVARSYGADNYAYIYSVMSTWDMAARKMVSKCKMGRTIEKRALPAEQGDGMTSAFKATNESAIRMIRP
ncbi:MAG TPA: hypothetical protein DCM87_15280 [Planctomycetes bacterium]|nr:hypothetical protein [Planctomycetota bacterium]